MDAGPAAVAPTFTPAAGTFTTAQSVAIASTTPGATIYFTLDGTNPTTASVVYSSPIAVTQTTTIRAMAAAPGFQNSTVTAGTFTISIQPGITAPVAITPAAQTAANPIAIGLSTTTSPSTICYTLDNSAPTCSAGACTGTAATYSAGSPIPVDAPIGGGTVTVKALACSAGNANSDPTSSVYSFKAAAPTAAPASGIVALNSNVTVQTATANSGANQVRMVYNTTTAGDPTCTLSDNDFGTGVQAKNVAITQNVTYRVVTCRTNYAASDSATFAYTVNVSDPTLNSGEKNNDFVPAATAGAVPNTGGAYCYSAGAVVPACNAAKTGCTTGSTTAPTVVSTPTTINVIACRPNFNDSAVVTGVYTLKVRGFGVNPFTAGTGINEDNATNFWNNGADQAFTLNTQTNPTAPAGTGDVKIRYTVTTAATPTQCNGCLPATSITPDCTTPTATLPAGWTEVVDTAAPSSTVTASLTASTFPTIRAIGCKTGYAPSDVRTFNFKDPLNSVTLDPLPFATGSTYVSDNTINLGKTPPAAGVLGVTPTVASGTNICYNVGINPVDADCNVTTGACVGSTLYVPGTGIPVTTTGFEVRAIACKTGILTKSNKQTQAYQLKLGTPALTTTLAPAGTAVGSGNLAFGATSYFHDSSEPSRVMGSTAGDCASTTNQCVRYTTDGTTPSCNTGTVYNTATGYVYSPNAQSTTVKAIACSGGYLPSDVQTLTFNTVLAAPTYTPNNTNPLRNTTVVNLTSPSQAGGGFFCYTVDGSQPGCNGTVCAAPATTTQTNAAGPNLGTSAALASGTRVRAITCRNNFNASSETDQTFTVKVSTPTVTPATATYGAAQTITMTTPSGVANTANNLRICYSLGGQSLTTAINNCAQVNGAVTCTALLNAGDSVTPAPVVGTNTTLTVQSCRTNFAPSDPVSRVLTFTPYSKPINVTSDLGTDDFQSVDNANVIPAENNGNGYFSWDGTNLYFGYLGAAISGQADNFFNVYIRGAGAVATNSRDNRLAPGITFGTTNADNPAQIPNGGAEYHFWLRGDRVNSANLTGASKYSGAVNGWQSDATAITCQAGGTINTATSYVECSIPRSILGGNTLSWQGIVTRDLVNARSHFPFTGGAAKRWTGDLTTNVPSDATRIQ